MIAAVGASGSWHLRTESTVWITPLKLLMLLFAVLSISSTTAGTMIEPVAAELEAQIESVSSIYKLKDQTTAFPNADQVNPGDVPADLHCDPAGGSSQYSESLDLLRRLRIVVTSQCPNHYSFCQQEGCGGSNATLALVKYTRLEMPLYPTLAAQRTDATCTAEPLGVALNGVPLRGPKDSDWEVDALGSRPGTRTCGTPSQFDDVGTAVDGSRSSCSILGPADGILYCGDGLAASAPSIDKCGGTTDSKGSYHYRAAPLCLLAQLSSSQSSGSISNLNPLNTSTVVDSSGTVRSLNVTTSPTNPMGLASADAGAIAQSPLRAGLSPQLGWALDGFPVYGPRGPKGVFMRRCGLPGAHPTLCLDYCNGLEASLPGIDNYLYRYFMPGDFNYEQRSPGMSDGDPWQLRDVRVCSRRINMTDSPTATSASESMKVVDCARTDSDACCAAALPGHRLFYPYSIGCFRGCLAGDIACMVSGQPGVSRFFQPALARGLVAYPSNAPDSNTSGNSSGVGVGVGLPVPVFSASLQTVMPAPASHSPLPVNRNSSVDHLANASSGVAAYVATRVVGSNRAVTLLSPTNAPQNSILDSLPGQLVELPTSTDDCVITSLALDEDFNTLYYATSTGIYSLLDKGQDFEQGADPTAVQPDNNRVVAGLLRVTIRGAFLGRSLSDVLSISLPPSVPLPTPLSPPTNECLSIVVTAADASGVSEVTCLYTLRDPTALLQAGLTAANVSILVRNRAPVVGPTPDPTTALASGSGLPVVFDIDLLQVPFSPYALTILETADIAPKTSSTDATERPSELVLYWSNVGLGLDNYVEADTASQSVGIGLGVYRCSADGLQVEKVLDSQSIKSASNASGSLEQVTALQAVDLSFAVDHTNKASWLAPPPVPLYRQQSSATSPLPDSDLLMLLQASGGIANSGVYVAVLPRMQQGRVFDATLPTTTQSQTMLSWAAASAEATGTSINGSNSMLGPSISPLLLGLESPSGISLDLASRSLFVSTFYGLVLRLDMSAVLAVALQQHRNGLPLTLPLDGRAIGPNAVLAPWINVLWAAPSFTRLMGVASLPLLHSSSIAGGVYERWKEQRVLAVDTNQQILSLLSETGLPVATLDLSRMGQSRYSQVQWPSAATIKRRGNTSEAVVEVYIAEFFGRVWKLQLPRQPISNSSTWPSLPATSQTSLLLPTAVRNSLSTPRLLLDRSDFPASGAVRSLLAQARASGRPPYEAVFFEARN